MVVADSQLHRRHRRVPGRRRARASVRAAPSRAVHRPRVGAQRRDRRLARAASCCSPTPTSSRRRICSRAISRTTTAARNRAVVGMEVQVTRTRTICASATIRALRAPLHGEKPQAAVVAVLSDRQRVGAARRARPRRALRRRLHRLRPRGSRARLPAAAGRDPDRVRARTRSTTTGIRCRGTSSSASTSSPESRPCASIANTPPSTCAAARHDAGLAGAARRGPAHPAARSVDRARRRAARLCAHALVPIPLPHRESRPHCVDSSFARVSCGALDRRRRRPRRRARRLGAPAARSRRPDLHRRARPRRHHAGDVRSVERRDVFARAETLRSEFVVRVRGDVRRRPAGTENAKLATGEVEVPATQLEILNRVEDAAVRHRGRRRAGRGGAAALPLPRPAPAADAAQPHRAPPHRQSDARLLRRARLHRDRDAEPDQVDARGRARLSRAVARPPRHVLRAAAVAADPQADPDDRRPRPLHADRPLLPRRGSARRPPAGVHASSTSR